MVVYEVTLDVAPALMEAVASYMRGQHIPAILATRCFRRIHLERTSPTRIRTRYEADGRAALEGYLEEFSPHYRAEFQSRFPTGLVASREIWTEEGVWP
jgi:hypothetical protein